MMAKRKTSGQVPFNPTDEQRKLVAILASCGTPQDTIASFVHWPAGISDDAGKPITSRTLRKVFRRELDAGMDLAHAELVRTAFHVATVDKVPSVLIFLLKTRLGWKEPAQEINLNQTYGQLVEAAAKKAEDERTATKLTVVQGGKAAA